MSTIDEAQALEKIIYDLYGDVLSITGIYQSGTGAYLVRCSDRLNGMDVTFFHKDDLITDYGARGDIDL